jgi:hypothetical protein
MGGHLGARSLPVVRRYCFFNWQCGPFLCCSPRPVFLAFPNQPGFRYHDCRAGDCAQAAGGEDFRRHQSRRRCGRSARRGAIGRLPEGRTGSNGYRRFRYQPSSLGTKPARYRRDHPAPHHARRFPHRVRKAERNARRDHGVGSAITERHHSRLYLGRAGPANHIRTLSVGLCRGVRARGNTHARDLCPPQSVAPGGGSIGNVELSSRPAAACRAAWLRRTGREFLRRQSNLTDRRRRRDRGAGDIWRAGAGSADRRRHRSICPDRTLDFADRRRTDRRQQ